MKVSQLLALAVLMSASSVEGAVIQQKSALRDFNGADEDEIMDRVFSKYSVEGTDHNGVKNGQRILMKTTAPKAAGVILEATHKLKGNQVPGYIKANFEKAWNKFDINQDGFIKAEETHTFMRSLMGKLNKFALAPGSLSDIGSGTESLAATTVTAEAEVAKPVKKAAPAPKKVEKQAAEPENDPELEAEAMKQLEAQLAGAAEGGEDASLIDIGQDEN